jgi:hypothetical protein
LSDASIYCTTTGREKGEITENHGLSTVLSYTTNKCTFFCGVMEAKNSRIFATCRDIPENHGSSGSPLFFQRLVRTPEFHYIKELQVFEHGDQHHRREKAHKEKRELVGAQRERLKDVDDHQREKHDADYQVGYRLFVLRHDMIDAVLLFMCCGRQHGAYAETPQVVRNRRKRSAN